MAEEKLLAEVLVALQPQPPAGGRLAELQQGPLAPQQEPQPQPQPQAQAQAQAQLQAQLALAQAQAQAQAQAPGVQGAEEVQGHAGAQQDKSQGHQGHEVDEEEDARRAKKLRMLRPITIDAGALSGDPQVCRQQLYASASPAACALMAASAGDAARAGHKSPVLMVVPIVAASPVMDRHNTAQ